MKNFYNLRFQCKKFLKAIKGFRDKDKIISALSLAQEAHKNQKRDEGQEYIIHPIRVVNFLIYELSVKDTDLLIAALLHDVVEDTTVELCIIKNNFGDKVAVLVDKLTRNKDRETKQEKFEKTLNEDNEVRLLKASDWLDNLRSFPERKDRGERFFRHIKEASEMYLPMAESVNSYIASEMKKVIKKLPNKNKILNK